MSTDQWIKISGTAALPLAALIFGMYQFRSTVEIGRQQSERDLRMKFVDFTWAAIKDGDTATVFKALRVLSSVDRNAAVELADVVYPPTQIEFKDDNPVSMVAMQGIATIPITLSKRVPLTDWESRSFQSVRNELLSRYPSRPISETRTKKMDHEAIRIESSISYGPGEKEFAIAFKAIIDSVVPDLRWSSLKEWGEESGLHLSLCNPEQ